MLFGLGKSVFAQTNTSLIDIKNEMNELYSELVQIDQEINSFNSVKSFEGKYVAHKNLMESCFNAYSIEIRENKEMLYPIYENYQTLYSSIGNKIETYKQNENVRIETERVKSTLGKYEGEMKTLLPKAKDFCKNKKTDSLEKTKSGANSIFNKAIALQSSNTYLFEGSETLEKTMNSISNSHDEINALTIKQSKIWDILFKIIIVIGMVLMAGNIISSKISMMKAMKPSVKSQQHDNKNKKEEEFSI